MPDEGEEIINIKVEVDDSKLDELAKSRKGRWAGKQAGKDFAEGFNEEIDKADLSRHLSDSLKIKNVGETTTGGPKRAEISRGQAAVRTNSAKVLAAMNDHKVYIDRMRNADQRNEAQKRHDAAQNALIKMATAPKKTTDEGYYNKAGQYVPTTGIQVTTPQKVTEMLYGRNTYGTNRLKPKAPEGIVKSALPAKGDMADQEWFDKIREARQYWFTQRVREIFMHGEIDQEALAKMDPKQVAKLTSTNAPRLPGTGDAVAKAITESFNNPKFKNFTNHLLKMAQNHPIMAINELKKFLEEQGYDTNALMPQRPLNEYRKWLFGSREMAVAKDRASKASAEILGKPEPEPEKYVPRKRISTKITPEMIKGKKFLTEGYGDKSQQMMEQEQKKAKYQKIRAFFDDSEDVAKEEERDAKHAADYDATLKEPAGLKPVRPKLSNLTRRWAGVRKGKALMERVYGGVQETGLPKALADAMEKHFPPEEPGIPTGPGLTGDQLTKLKSSLGLGKEIGGAEEDPFGMEAARAAMDKMMQEASSEAEKAQAAKEDISWEAEVKKYTESGKLAVDKAKETKPKKKAPSANLEHIIGVGLDKAKSDAEKTQEKINKVISGYETAPGYAMPEEEPETLNVQMNKALGGMQAAKPPVLTAPAPVTAPVPTTMARGGVVVPPEPIRVDVTSRAAQAAMQKSLDTLGQRLAPVAAAAQSPKGSPYLGPPTEGKPGSAGFREYVGGELYLSKVEADAARQAQIQAAIDRQYIKLSNMTGMTIPDAMTFHQKLTKILHGVQPIGRFLKEMSHAADTSPEALEAVATEKYERAMRGKPAEKAAMEGKPPISEPTMAQKMFGQEYKIKLSFRDYDEFKAAMDQVQQLPGWTRTATKEFERYGNLGTDVLHTMEVRGHLRGGADIGERIEQVRRTAEGIATGPSAVSERSQLEIGDKRLSLQEKLEESSQRLNKLNWLMVRGQMALLGIAFSMMSVTRMLQNAWGTISKSLSNLTNIFKDLGMAIAFGPSGAQEFLRGFLGQSTQIVSVWKKLTGYQATINTLLAYFAFRLLQDTRIIKSIEDLIMFIIEKLSDQAFINSIAELLSTIIEALPGMVTWVKAIVDMLNGLFKLPFAKEILSGMFGLALAAELLMGPLAILGGTIYGLSAALGGLAKILGVDVFTGSWLSKLLGAGGGGAGGIPAIAPGAAATGAAAEEAFAVSGGAAGAGGISTILTQILEALTVPTTVATAGTAALVGGALLLGTITTITVVGNIAVEKANIGFKEITQGQIIKELGLDTTGSEIEQWFKERAAVSEAREAGTLGLRGDQGESIHTLFTSIVQPTAEQLRDELNATIATIGESGAGGKVPEDYVQVITDNISDQEAVAQAFAEGTKTVTGATNQAMLDGLILQQKNNAAVAKYGEEWRAALEAGLIKPDQIEAFRAKYDTAANRVLNGGENVANSLDTAANVIKAPSIDSMQVQAANVTLNTPNLITNTTGGSAFDYWFGGGKAAGGPVKSGVPIIVGEKGPEVFVPGSSGNIIPNHMIGYANGTVGNLTSTGNMSIIAENVTKSSEILLPASEAIQKGGEDIQDGSKGLKTAVVDLGSIVNAMGAKVYNRMIGGESIGYWDANTGTYQNKDTKPVSGTSGGITPESLAAAQDKFRAATDVSQFASDYIGRYDEIVAKPIARIVDTTIRYNSDMQELLLRKQTAEQLGDFSSYSWVPKLATGGFIDKTGVAVVHKGESVVPADETESKNVNITNYVTATVNNKTDEKYLLEVLGRKYYSGAY